MKNSESQQRNFFDFDAADWYNIEFDLKDLPRHIQDDWCDLEKLKAQVIYHDRPESIEQIGFEQELNELGFQKSQLSDSEKLQSINELFTERFEGSRISASKCIAIYRDIIVFKKSQKVVGIAKICLSCSKHKIIGSKADTIGFGQSGEYDLLEDILYPNRKAVEKFNRLPNTKKVIGRKKRREKN